MTSRLVVLVAAVLLLRPEGVRAVDVDAGSLRAVLDADPWRLRFEDADGTTLAEASDRSGTPAGPRGFRTPSGWAHATRIVTRRATRKKLKAVVETTDSGGRRLDVELRVDAEGVLALRMAVAGGPHADVDAFGIGFEAVAAAPISPRSGRSSGSSCPRRAFARATTRPTSPGVAGVSPRPARGAAREPSRAPSLAPAR